MEKALEKRKVRKLYDPYRCEDCSGFILGVHHKNDISKLDLELFVFCKNCYRPSVIKFTNGEVEVRLAR